MIVKIKALLWPQFRFEYHPEKQKVYLIRVGVQPEIGEVFAHDITTEGAAHNAVLIWLRGYRAARGDRWDDGGRLIRSAQE